MKGRAELPNPLNPAAQHAGVRLARLRRPRRPICPPRRRPAYVDGNSTPFAGRTSRSRVDTSAVGCRLVGCPQPAWISRPSSSSGTRTTSRVGGGFSCSGGLRPKLSRMRLIEISSVM